MPSAALLKGFSPAFPEILRSGVLWLPNVENVRVDRNKIVEYLLEVDHPEGAGKAAFFLRFGFTTADWQMLASCF